MVDEKPPGQGKGRFTRAGVQADQEARIAAIEAFLEEQFPAEETPEEPAEPSA